MKQRLKRSRCPLTTAPHRVGLEAISTNTRDLQMEEERDRRIVWGDLANLQLGAWGLRPSG